MANRCFALFLLVARAWASNASSDTSGSSACKCIDPVELEGVTATGGKVSFTSGKTSGVSEVDAAYGTSCKAWDTEDGSEYYSDCTTDNASWCTTAWCYIDMCNCDQADMGSSSYFTVDSKLKLGYSYKTCEAEATSGTDSYLTTYCTAAAPACSSLSCKNQTADGSTTCVPKTAAEITAAAGCSGKDGCKCISPVGMGCVASSSSKVTFNNPTSGICEVPDQYGAGCAAWDTAEGMEFNSECKADADSPPSWCKDPWCYIDMCDCDAADLAAATYFSASVELKIGYSYQTCDGSAESTSDYLTTFCTGKDEDACTTTKVCKTVSGSCAKMTSEEITEGLGCTEATTECTSAGAAATCTTADNSSAAPAPASGPATTTSACYGQRMPSVIAVVWAVTAVVFG